jgi:hypothetical protein
MLNLYRTLLLAGTLLPIVGFAQAPATQSIPPVPTTKILAIGRITPGNSSEPRTSVMPAEIQETVLLYLGGKIDQWYVRKDQGGVVFIFNVNTVEDARALLDGLPSGKSKRLEFDLIPLGPLSPLRILLSNPSSVRKQP